MRTDLTSKKDQYISNVFGAESDLLKSVRRKLAEDKKEGINIAPNEARILQTLIASAGVKRIVEVGCLYGYSALWMADALPEGGELHTLELNEDNAKVAKSFFDQSANKDKIKLHVGDAVESLEALSTKAPFDLVFIDANKGGYMKYLNWAIENVKLGGLIVGDNTFLFGHVFGEGPEKSNVGKNQLATMLEFNEVMANQQNFYSCILPTSEGMTVAVKKR